MYILNSIKINFHSYKRKRFVDFFHFIFILRTIRISVLQKLHIILSCLSFCISAILSESQILLLAFSHECFYWQLLSLGTNIFLWPWPLSFAFFIRNVSLLITFQQWVLQLLMFQKCISCDSIFLLCQDICPLDLGHLGMGHCRQHLRFTYSSCLMSCSFICRMFGRILRKYL